MKQITFIFIFSVFTVLSGISVQEARAEIIYTGFAGGLDRGDSASLPTLGFKLAFDSSGGAEVTYARGAIKSEGSFFEKERALALTFRTISSGFIDTVFGAGFGAVNSTSEAQGHTESVTNVAIVINSGLNLVLSNSFAFKMGLDSFILPIPSANPLYSHGVRNIWFLGFEITI